MGSEMCIRDRSIASLGIFFLFFASNDDDDQDGGKLIKSLERIN